MRETASSHCRRRPRRLYTHTQTTYALCHCARFGFVDCTPLSHLPRCSTSPSTEPYNGISCTHCCLESVPLFVGNRGTGRVFSSSILFVLLSLSRLFVLLQAEVYLINTKTNNKIDGTVHYSCICISSEMLAYEIRREQIFISDKTANETEFIKREFSSHAYVVIITLGLEYIYTMCYEWMNQMIATRLLGSMEQWI